MNPGWLLTRVRMPGLHGRSFSSQTPVAVYMNPPGQMAGSYIQQL